jgi:hypothetical protein
MYYRREVDLKLTKLAHCLEAHGMGYHERWFGIKRGDRWYLYVKTDRGWEQYADTRTIEDALAYLISDPERLDAAAGGPRSDPLNDPPTVQLSEVETAALEILAGHPALRDALIDTLAKGG